MIPEPILNLYERKVGGKTLVFAEQSSSLDNDTGNTMLTGIAITPDNVVSVSMDYDKMLSRGWKKVDNPLLSLRNMMRNDVAKLKNSDPLGLIPAVPDMIGYYADKLDSAILNILINNLENK